MAFCAMGVCAHFSFCLLAYLRDKLWYKLFENDEEFVLDEDNDEDMMKKMFPSIAKEKQEKDSFEGSFEINSR